MTTHEHRPTWVEGAAGGPFDVDNLPYAVFSVGGDQPRVGTRIGDLVVDLAPIAASDMMAGAEALAQPSLSELLREVSDTVALAEQMPGVLVPMADEPVESTPVAPAAVRKATNRGVRQVTSDGSVAVQVRQDSPLKATLRSTRVRPADRDVVCAA